ncbi:transferase, Chloramphenicol acetyltransferase-like domain protein [Artemisia annua]|uniref:Transferase, Chloramphenicol acetyltransferase-like domain protein n=1 Tax=Artemisia annua TaxID=35608 RepID=A0A2U1PNN0_ARTAN|nr:transferase, Chloramphenicol acetyltransferase-like domain protein [Artemisia annua]
MKVTVDSKELIVPSSPTPPDLKTYNLSYIDQQVPPYYISFILYYLYDDSSTITQSNIIIKLKTSLSKTLTHYYPLAGRLAKNRNTVDCNDQGVQFLVARVESNLLDMIKSPIIEELNQLMMVEPSYVDEQLAIQVNFFECGGIAIGVSISHRIGDAYSISLFVSQWFAMIKGSETTLVCPVLDSSVLFPPMESHAYSRNPKNPMVHVPVKNLVTKRFVFSSVAINRLKREVVKGTNTLVNPTRVEVVTALIWKCGTVALGDCQASVAFHVVNVRSKMVPLLQDNQFGNVFQMAYAVTDQTVDMDMGSLVVMLRGSFEKINSQYLKKLTGENGVEMAKGNFRQIRDYMIQEGARVFRFSSWCRLVVNECDFGWGTPVWVSSANFNDENCIILMDSRKDDGIEAWVVMNENDMHKFEHNIQLQEYVSSATS